MNDSQMDALRKRLRRVNHDIATMGTGIRDTATKGLNFVKADLLTGYSYGEFYDWDLYFENIYLSYFGESRYCRNNVEAFLDRQLPCGFVARTLVNPRMRQHFKPFLAQTALLGCRQTGDFRWLIGKYYQRLGRYLDYWFIHCDTDRNGLCAWDSADHSGMDNQVLRAGEIGTMEIEGVDLNCYLYRELLAMEAIAGALGHPEDAARYHGEAAALAERINAVFWDDADGFYYDRNERTGASVRRRSIAGFLPLWGGIASKDRAERIIRQHLLDPEAFWLSYPIATWAKNEAGYYQQRRDSECNWMGPCWIPLNYMIFHGLMAYGYTEEAELLARRSFEMVMAEPDIREYYNAETGSGQGLNPFWGWSSLALMMPLEFEMRYDPTAFDGGILPIATDRLGVRYEREG